MSSATIFPADALEGSVKIPASKPHIQRALLLALLNKRTTKLANITWCTETKSLLVALLKFGLQVVEEQENAILLRGVGRDISVQGEIHAAGSGMLFRICSALATLTQDPVRIQCNSSLFSRESIFDDGFSSQLGIHAFRMENNFIEVRRREYTTKIPLDIKNSTQFISFALFVSPYRDEKFILVNDADANGGYVDMSIKAMRLLGSEVTRLADRINVSDYIHRDIVINIPSDFTSLSYIASSVLSAGDKSDVRILNYHPGETINERVLLDVYRTLGVSESRDSANHTLRLRCKRPTSQLQAEISLKELPSAATNIMAAASNSLAQISFSGVSGINNHKCQRAFVISENIRRMGGSNSMLFNEIGMFEKLLINGHGPLGGGVELKSYKDHRVCAANLIAALGAKKECLVHDTEKLDDGFPGLIEALKSLGVNIKLSN